MLNILLCTQSSYRALCRARPVKWLTRTHHTQPDRARHCLHLTGNLVVPVGLCTLLIRPDMSHTHVTTRIVGDKDTGAVSVRQAGFTKD